MKFSIKNVFINKLITLDYLAIKKPNNSGTDELLYNLKTQGVDF